MYKFVQVCMYNKIISNKKMHNNKIEANNKKG